MQATHTTQATTQLPAGYSPQRVFSLKSSRALILMNLVGIILLIASGYLFVNLFRALRPVDLAQALTVEASTLADLVRIVVVAALVIAGMIIFHEAAHGLFFWIFTRSRPVFAFKGAYAYAAAPGWFIPRNQYLVIGFAPLVIISLVGVALSAIVPTGWLLPLLILLIFNAAGAVGDLWVTLSLLVYPASAYCYDQGDSTTVYLPAGA